MAAVVGDRAGEHPVAGVGEFEGLEEQADDFRVVGSRRIWRWKVGSGVRVGVSGGGGGLVADGDWGALAAARIAAPREAPPSRRRSRCFGLDASMSRAAAWGQSGRSGQVHSDSKWVHTAGRGPEDDGAGFAGTVARMVKLSSSTHSPWSWRTLLRRRAAVCKCSSSKRSCQSPFSRKSRMSESSGTGGREDGVDGGGGSSAGIWKSGWRAAIETADGGPPSALCRGIRLFLLGGSVHGGR